MTTGLVDSAAGYSCCASMRRAQRHLDILISPKRLELAPQSRDVSCASYGRTSFVNNFPKAVGKYTTDLAILHEDNPNYVELRNSLIQTRSRRSAQMRKKLTTNGVD